MAPIRGYTVVAFLGAFAWTVTTGWASAANLSSDAAKRLCITALKKDPIALWSLRHAAAGGDAQGEYWLGRYYLQQRKAKAFLWLSKPEVRSMKALQRALGICYLLGLGTHKSLPTAIKCFRVAAKNGNAAAQYALGQVYAQGYGVPKSIPNAITWYKAAARDGPASIQRAAQQRILAIEGALAVAKAETLFRQDHYNRAFNSIQGVASKGYAPAEFLMGNFYAAHHAPNAASKIAALPDAEVTSLFAKADAGAKALHTLRAAAANGDANAAFALGLWYEHHMELHRAISWIGGAAHWGVVPDIGLHADPAAQFELARLFMAGGVSGLPIPEPPFYARRQVRMLLLRSARHGNASAEDALGSLYYFGNGLQYRIGTGRKKAKYWLTKAAAQGDKHAILLLKQLSAGGGAGTITIGQ